MSCSTDDTLGHFAVNGFFTSTYDDVRDLNLNNFLAYFGECGEEDISEEEFAQLNAKWEFRVDSVEDFPLPIHRYPASAVEDVLKRFAGIGLADLTDMQTPVFRLHLSRRHGRILYHHQRLQPRLFPLHQRRDRA